YLVAGDPGQRGVEYCRSRPSCPEELQRLKPIRGLGRAKTRAFEEGRELVAHRRVPVGDQDRASRICRRRHSPAAPSLGTPTSNPKANALQETVGSGNGRRWTAAGCSP